MHRFQLFFDISIRAPARGATSIKKDNDKAQRFQSALPRGERLVFSSLVYSPEYFNPRSREGSDSNQSGLLLSGLDFNPRSREGSDKMIADRFHVSVISIRAPARGATCIVPDQGRFHHISIRAPARGATVIRYFPF